MYNTGGSSWIPGSLLGDGKPSEEIEWNCVKLHMQSCLEMFVKTSYGVDRNFWTVGGREADICFTVTGGHIARWTMWYSGTVHDIYKCFSDESSFFFYSMKSMKSWLSDSLF